MKGLKQILTLQDYFQQDDNPSGDANKQLAISQINNNNNQRVQTASTKYRSTNRGLLSQQNQNGNFKSDDEELSDQQKPQTRGSMLFTPSSIIKPRTTSINEMQSSFQITNNYLLQRPQSQIMKTNSNQSIRNKLIKGQSQTQQSLSLAQFTTVPSMQTQILTIDNLENNEIIENKQSEISNTKFRQIQKKPNNLRLITELSPKIQLQNFTFTSPQATNQDNQISDIDIQQQLQQPIQNQEYSSQKRQNTQKVSIVQQLFPKQEQLLQFQQQQQQQQKVVQREKILQQRQSEAKMSILKNVKMFSSLKKTDGKQQKKILYYVNQILRSLNDEKKKMENHRYPKQEIVDAIQKSSQSNLVFLNASIPILKQICENIQIHETVDSGIQSLIRNAGNLRNQQLQMIVMIVSAKMQNDLRNPEQSMIILKNCKHISDLSGDNKVRMKCYKGMGQSLLMMGKYEKALPYICKFLELTWLINDQHQELKAFDLLGLIYYYIGDIKKANYYHNRMVIGINENKDSGLRKLSLINLQSRQKKIQDLIKKGELIQQMNDSCDLSELKNILLTIPEPPIVENSARQKGNSISNHDRIEANNAGDSSLKDYNPFEAEHIRRNINEIPLREVLPFYTNSQPHYWQQIKEKANNNIRIPKEMSALEMISRKPQQYTFKKQLSIGPLRRPLIVKHLSNNAKVNQFLEQESQIKKNMNQKRRIDNPINYWEGPDFKNISKQVKKLDYIFKQSIQLIEKFLQNCQSPNYQPDIESQYKKVPSIINVESIQSINCQQQFFNY